MYTVIIADVNRGFAQSLAVALAATAGFQVLALVHSGAQLLQSIARFRPEVLLMEISFPDISGVEIVRQVRYGMPGYVPLICVLSTVSATYTQQALADLGISFFQLKPVSCEMLAENLHNHLDGRRRFEDWDKPHPPPLQDLSRLTARTEVSTGAARITMQQQIELLLHELGACPHLACTRSVVESLAFCLQNPAEERRLTKRLYPEIARLEGVSCASIERRIRYCISRLQKEQTPLFIELFNYDGRRKITNGEFMFIATKYLLNQKQR